MKSASPSIKGSLASKPVWLKPLVVVLLVMGLIAIPSGIVLLADPSGSVIGGEFILPHLSGAIPFVHDFTPVGLWLLFVYGITPIVLAVNLLRDKRWAWVLTIALGIVEIAWIGVELLFFYDLGFNPMYPLIGGIGIATLALALFPSLRRYYSATPGARSLS